jgi:hypothetical protein
MRMNSRETFWPSTANWTIRPAFASNDPSGLTVRAV